MVADHLTRLENGDEGCEKEGSIKEEFPDEFLFSVQITHWFADFANFLASDILPPNRVISKRKNSFLSLNIICGKNLFCSKCV